MLNCSADPQPTGFDFVEWTITSDFLPEGQRLTAEQMRDLHERLNVPIAARSKVYVSDILGNAAWEGELTIKGLDAAGAEVIQLQAGLASGGCGAQPTFDPVKPAKGCGAEKF